MIRLFLIAFGVVGRARDRALAEVPAVVRTFDFRDGKANLLARLEVHLAEAKIAHLAACIDYFNLAGLTAADVALVQQAFRQDATA